MELERVSSCAFFYIPKRSGIRDRKVTVSLSREAGAETYEISRT